MSIFRRKSEPEGRRVPYAWVENRDQRIEEFEAAQKRWKDGINALLANHKPKVDSEMFQVGWSGEKRIWCNECSRAWPCKVFNDLRWLYGTAVDWEPDTRPYPPLVVPAPPKVEDPS